MTSKEISLLLRSRIKGYCKSDMARAIGINRLTIYTAISGTQNPSMDTVCKIASALGLEVTLTEKK